MDADQYWEELVRKVHREKAELLEPEKNYYLIRCLLGEIWTGGILGFFGEHGHNYIKVRSILLQGGHNKFIDQLDRAFSMIFGNKKIENKEDAQGIFVDFLETLDSKDGDFCEKELKKISSAIYPMTDIIDDWIVDYGIKYKLFNG